MHGLISTDRITTCTSTCTPQYSLPQQVLEVSSLVPSIKHSYTVHVASRRQVATLILQGVPLAYLQHARHGRLPKLSRDIEVIRVWPG